MRRYALALAAALVCSGVAAPTEAAGMLEWTGTVKRVVDGDTIEIDIAGDGKPAVHVRNAGIQALETGQCGASIATKALKAMVSPGQTVVLRARDASSTSTDGSGRVRPLRYVDLKSGLDVQLELLKRGLVLAYPLGARELARQDKYHRAAQKAAQDGIGLYSGTVCARGPQQGARLRLWVNWDADGHDSENLNGEYVRLLNEGTKSLDLAGWWLRSPTNARYTFPAGTAIAPGKYLTLHSGSGQNTSSHFYWGGKGGRFYNVKPDGVHAFGAYLFDPDGDLRSWSMYPCTWGCWEPLSTVSNVTWTANYQPDGDEREDPNLETVDLTNTSSRRIDASFRVVTIRGRLMEFGPNSYVDPGETLRVHMGHGTQRRLHKYLGNDTQMLFNSGGSVILRNTEGVQIACARWGDGGLERFRCTPTVARTIERVRLTSTDFGRALQLEVVPSGGLDYVLQHRQPDGSWDRFTTGTTSRSGRASLDAPAGRYRVVVPAQLGYAKATSKAVDHVPTPTIEVTGGASELGVTVRPDTAPDAWAVRVERDVSGTWQEVTSTTTDANGLLTLPLPNGTYRVVVPAAAGYARAVSASVRVGLVQLRASLALGAKVGTVKVNVNPNREGTASWSFKLQRRSGTSWVRVGTYQTQGSFETRVLRYLPSGTYRVRVPAQSDALAGVSPELEYTAPRAEVSLRVGRETKLKINAEPALPGTKDFKVKIDKRSAGRWGTYLTTSTQGTPERVVVDVPRGTYRVRLPQQHGYLGAASPKRFVAR